MLEKFRFSTPLDIRYGDMDTLGHVNNSKYLTYIEQARIQYIRDMGLWHGGAAEFGLIVARITIDYKIPLSMDDKRVLVFTRTSRLGNKSLNVEAIVVREHDHAVAAVTETICVCYDYTKNETVEIPQSWRDNILAYEPALNA